VLIGARTWKTRFSFLRQYHVRVPGKALGITPIKTPIGITLWGHFLISTVILYKYTAHPCMNNVLVRTSTTRSAPFPGDSRSELALPHCHSCVELCRTIKHTYIMENRPYMRAVRTPHRVAYRTRKSIINPRPDHALLCAPGMRRPPRRVSSFSSPSL
jgi:hypothetical protein